MLQAIPTVCNKIFGISYLQDQQDQLRTQWQLRMAENDGFFIEAKPEDDYKTTVTALFDLISKQYVTINPHDHCILTFFVDLRKKVDPELLRKIEAGIKSALNCNIQAVLQFGYVGKLGLEDPAVQRENACKLVETNQKFVAIQHRLCLVASPFLAGSVSNEWKSVCVYLDVLSRQSSPQELIPGTGSGYAGFLRYGEFNQVDYDALEKRLGELKPILENGGKKEFDELLKAKEQELCNEIKQRFRIEGTFQPLHPDMFLEPGFLNKNHKMAKKGNHSAFNHAQRSSVAAVQMTGEQLKKDIAKAFDPSIAKAESILRELAEAAPLGFELREDEKEMAGLLAAPVGTGQKPSEVSLSFSEGGYAQEIRRYLEGIREFALSEQVQRFYEALQQASNTLVNEDTAKKKSELENEKKQVERRLKELLSPKEFCEKYASIDLPESQFSPVAGNAKQEKFLLCTNGLGGDVDKYVAGTGMKVYCMANTEPDGSPLKAVQIISLTCPNNGDPREVMTQLLPEVKI